MQNTLENGLESALEICGFPEESRRIILAMHECGCEAELLAKLKMHRCSLIEEMHGIQKKIDCTDDLIRMHRR